MNLASIIFWIAVLAAFAAGLEAAPQQNPAVADAALPSNLHDLLRAETTNRFERVSVYKPAEILPPNPTLPDEKSKDVSFTPSGSESDRFHSLAPIILLEDSGSAPPRSPAVFVCEQTVNIRGSVYAQMAYVWRWDDQAGCEATKPAAWQGVRLTLDQRGNPMIWEVLAPRRGQRILYVSMSLEYEARRTLGPPLPGRRFSLEAPTNTAPDVLVARVIEDGPQPMGPIVYLSGKSREVVSLICRCMPSQARTVSGNEYYTLVGKDAGLDSASAPPPKTVAALGERGGARRPVAAERPSVPPLPVGVSDLRYNNSCSHPLPLDRVLRLPEAFFPPD